jgi:hypothetical protein
MVSFIDGAAAASAIKIRGTSRSPTGFPLADLATGD